VDLQLRDQRVVGVGHLGRRVGRRGLRLNSSNRRRRARLLLDSLALQSQAKATL
jgi:hypothetical protein